MRLRLVRAHACPTVALHWISFTSGWGLPAGAEGGGFLGVMVETVGGLVRLVV